MEKILSELRPQIDSLLREKTLVIIAIDGKCTSGKTTLAKKLAEIYDCNVFHMDDFFLRPEQRTEERFAQIGGNVDYERFYEEVLCPLKAGQAFAYRPFDCATFTLAQPVSVSPKALNIIEGTYSLHPCFGDPYDLKILLTVDEKIQRERVLQRPAFLHKRFFEEWIPMENRYFDDLGERAATEELKTILREHAKRYPAMEPTDAVKLIYQNEFGGGHLIRDEKACLNYLRREYETVEKNASVPLKDYIGNGICRVNLAAVNKEDIEQLGRDFIDSAARHKGDMNSFRAKLSVLAELTAEGLFSFDSAALEAYLKEYEKAEYPPVSHSQAYQDAYRPAYRITKV